MPTVIGINEVPREIVRPKWYEDMGYAQGRVANQLLMALMGQMGSGGGPFAQKNIPNPGYDPMRSVYGDSQNNRINPGVSFQSSSGPSNTAPYPQVPKHVLQQISTPAPTPSPFADQKMLNQKQFEILQNLQKYQQEAAESQQRGIKSTLDNTLSSQQIEINKGVMNGDVVPITLPTGQTIYMRASKGGLVPIDTGKPGSVHDRLREDEFNGVGTAPAPELPEELPNPKGLAEGTRARDTVTNQTYLVRKGAWVPE